MKSDFLTLKELYLQILTLTLQIFEHIESGDINAAQIPLEERGNVISKVSELKKAIQLSNEEQAQINELVAQIKETERVGIDRMEILKGEIQKEISSLNINKTAISAYKIKDEIRPRLFDARE